ncbi:MAG: ISL3 family transposase [Microscillaceae bacterium]|nr:ISL3 family transposase [Microscillaceae bacterium]
MEELHIYEALLNLPELVLDGVKLEKNRIEINCHLRVESRKCTNCGNLCSEVHQCYTRRLRDLNMAAREVYLLVKVRQFYCKNCHRYFTESLEFADPNKSHTHRQEDFMFMVGRKQSYAEAALILNTPPKTVERVVLAACKKSAALEARYARVRRLGIDEQSHRKGKKKYLCVLTDLDRGTLVDILESRKKEDLIAHFESLGKDFCAQITDVSCDYWDAYISVAKTCFPQANIILDRFHVTKLLNACVDDFRKALRKSAPSNENYRKLKWILYKQYHTLSDQELDELDLAFQDCPQLKEVYFSREKFHHILDNNEEVQKAMQDIDRWTQDIQAKDLIVFETFTKTLKSTKQYIANYVQDKLSNAVTEGLNNLIRSIRRIAFGMPNFEHLRWRALAISD